MMQERGVGRAPRREQMLPGLRFAPSGHRVLDRAEVLGREFTTDSVSTGLLVSALFDDPYVDGVFSAFSLLGEDVRRELYSHEPAMGAVVPYRYSLRAHEVLSNAQKEAARHRRGEVSSCDIAVAAVHVNNGGNVFEGILNRMHIDRDRLIKDLRQQQEIVTAIDQAEMLLAEGPAAH